MAKRKSVQKQRIELRKNQQSRTRHNDLTRAYDSQQINEDALSGERISGKGELTRKRTIITDSTEPGAAVPDAATNASPNQPSDTQTQYGRVLNAHGLLSTVELADGKTFQCATSRVLKSLLSSERQSVVAGDRVVVRLVNDSEGMIERIEPRHGILSRFSKKRQHILVANVDQIVIVASAAEPNLKPNLIDRFLISAEQGRIEPIICINKVDLVDVAELQPLIGVYSQMGYRVVLVSTKTGQGVDRMRRLFAGRETVVAGQSGVGKSSILNAIEPGLQLRIGAVSEENQKGKHTTTTAVLLPIALGGYMVDTPGIRQFELWDLGAAEVHNFYRDLRPFINRCKFPDCTHTHEADCGVKDAVADNFLDARRYESYLHLLESDGTS